MARRLRFRSTHARPSFTCGHIFGRGSSASWRGRFSRCFMRIMNTADATKLTASTTIAYGAVIAAMRPPVMLGPPTCATETVSCSFELPSTRCSRSISAGRYDWYATSKKTVKQPMTNVRTSRCQMRSTPSAQRIGMSVRSTARAESPTMRIWRRRRRSTQTPAGSAKRMKGRKPRTPRSENSIGLACRPTAASHGMASCDTCEPSSLMDWPAQSLTKSGCDHRPPDGRRSLGIRPPVHGRDECVRLAVRALRGAEILHQALQAALEAGEILLRQRRFRVAEAGALRRALELARGLAQHGGADGARVLGILGVEEEESRGAAVELLRDGAHLARAHDVDQPGGLEHLEVVADGALRDVELGGQLLRRERALA